MLRKSKLSVERLEDRLTPTVWGTPWPMPESLTLSFAPDGTDVGGTPSTLFQMLNQQAPTAAWESLFQQGFQAWAQYTNLKMSVVPDLGLPFGTAGNPQGDLRFGDIRVGAKLLPPSVVSTSSGFAWTGTTWSGDIILNSYYNFGLNGQGQYDLLTDAIHEIGHSLGLGDTSVDTTSVMYAHYTGPKTALSGQDILDIQAIYGKHDSSSDQHVFQSLPLLGNSSLLTALNLPLGFSNLGQDQRFSYLVNAGLVLGFTKNFYRISTPSAVAGTPLVMHVVAWNTDSNQLHPVIHVFDANNNPVPLQVLANANGTYSIQIVGMQPQSTYSVEVAASQPNGSNSLGNYFLGVEFDQNKPLTLAALSSGQLTAANPSITSSLTMIQSGLFEYNLGADTGTSSQDAIVMMTVTDQVGNVVMSLSAAGGQPPVTAVKYLEAGTYTVTFSARSKSGGGLPAVNFWLLGDKYTDPIGPYASDPTKSPSGSGGTSSSGSGYTYSGSSTSSPPQQY